MSRFWITRNQDTANQAHQVCSLAGLNQHDVFDLGPVSGATYKKRRLDNQNILFASDEEFVASTGSLIYEGKIGIQALTRVQDDFIGNISEIQQKSLGHYSLLISTGDTLYVFCDPEHSYDIYYTTTPSDSWMVSSHLSVLAHCIENLTVDTFSLYEHVLQSTDINGTTLYDETEKLLGHQHLEIELDSAEISLQEHVLPPSPINLSHQTLEEAVVAYADHVTEVFDSIKQAFPKSVGLQLTGGLDSRTILAGLLSVDHPPRTFTGVANDQITTADPRDMEVVEKLAERFKLETNRLDWDVNHLETSDSWADYFDRYGFYFTKFGAMPQFFNDWQENIPDHPQLMIKGLGPVFRDGKPWETAFQKERISFQELVENYYYSRKFPPNDFDNESKYKEYLVTELESAINSHYNLPTPQGRLPTEEYTRLKILTGRHRDTFVTNLRNEFSYYVAPFNMNTLLRPLLYVPDEYRQGGEFQLRLMKQLCRDILDEPVISGGISGGIQNLSGTNIKRQPSISSKMIQIAKNLPDSIYWRAGYLFQRYQQFNNSTQACDLRDFYVELLKESEIYAGSLNHSYYFGNLSDLNSFVLYDYAIEKAGYDKVNKYG